MRVKPFRGLRPTADLASRVPSYPYDVVDSNEARDLAADDPYTFLRVIKPEIDLEPDIDPYDDRVYRKALENFRRMQEKGWLVRDEQPAYYIYRLRMGDRLLTGVLGAASIHDYNEGHIRKHEHTRPDKERDRVRLNDSISAHPGPVLLTYRRVPQLDTLIATLAEGRPDNQFTAPDGIEHSLWAVNDADTCRQIESMFAEIPRTYVADGHHRTAAAAALHQERVARLQNSTGDEPVHYFMAAHFPSDQLHVLDYNNVVQDLNGLSVEEFLLQLQQAGFVVTRGHAARRPSQRGHFGMYLEGEWFQLSAGASMTRHDDVVEGLDVAILNRHVLQPVLGIGDPRTDKRIDFVGGIRGMDELERRVDSGAAAVAFAFHPTSLDDLMQVADTNQVMPPKSTWFEPKLRSGMVVQLLDGDTL